MELYAISDFYKGASYLSIVVSIIRDEFSMIAGDTRITYHHPNGRTEYNDSSQKIKCVGFSWIGSVGSAAFLHYFHSFLMNGAIRKTDDIEPFFYLACEEVKKLDNQINLDGTQVFYSFSYLEDQVLKMHIESINLKIGRTGVRDKNILVSFLPENSTSLEIIETRYRSLIQDSKDMKEVIYYTASYIEEVANINSTVGKVCDFGLTIKQSNSLILQVNIREEADIIKKAYLDKTLDNYLNVVAVLGE